MEESIIFDIDGPPSSPFVTEIEAPSCQPIKQWHQQPRVEDAEDTCAFTAKGETTLQIEFDMDKENVPEDEPTATMKPVYASPERAATIPLKQSTPEPNPLSERRRSMDSDLMPPPPSTRKNTPKKTPLKAIRSGANTPRPLSRGISHEKQQSASAFQAGLDLRNDQPSTPDDPSVDDTCFTAFSEIPEMTIFAKVGHSPTKRSEMTTTPGAKTEATPHTSRKRFSPSRSPSPTPRKQKTSAGSGNDGTTSFLIDFTQQMEGLPWQPSPGKSATEPDLLRHLQNQRSPAKPARHSYATPSKPNNILNLLDFELPPAPTPRSIPTITVRELESLKSSYLSQISSLKATLSGREAEVESLKRAVGDAERRVGEAQEALREERCRREHVEQEKADWEKRGKEVEQVLVNVKEEVLKSEGEKEELLRKLEEGERRVEDAEARAVKAEERFADALAARASSGDGDSNAIEEQVQRLVAAQLDSKIEAVSRELHGVYKEKHERKVATLKKSYEARSEKRCADLQDRLAELEKQNDELLAAKDNTFSGPLECTSNEAELKAQLEEQKAGLARLENEMQTSRAQQEQLLRELQQERIEKGDLVAAVDEMLALQSESGPSQEAISVVEDFRKSISRPSGLRAPGSRIGGPAGARSGIAAPGKSKLLSNIERMGRAGTTNGGE